jgi:hypothetical protein
VASRTIWTSALAAALCSAVIGDGGVIAWPWSACVVFARASVRDAPPQITTDSAIDRNRTHRETRVIRIIMTASNPALNTRQAQ